jgi:hypothetical protein
MKIPTKLPKNYFKKIQEKPVKIKPYNKKFEYIVRDYLKKLNNVLKPTGARAVPIGATALKISGKGDIDFGVYISEKIWDKVLKVLINYFKGISTLNSKGFAKFVAHYKGYEVEVVVRMGESAIRDKKLLEYFKKHPELTREYEQMKNKYSFSAREYAIQKNKFLRKVISMIPN